jgi:uncharacterized protein YjbI with pentapeptide repeats
MQKLDTGPIKSKRKSGAIATEVGKDVAQFLKQKDNPKFCPECDLSGADLTGANLHGVNLTYAILTAAYLTDADLSGANLTGVIGADFIGALNVPAKYLKR